ncbi:MAG TPA: NAD(P)/FAD-dependent oxidoreductase [Flavipsychrobacter sp.]|nr:NAD(P)/FAD-dependent oxidoreductase [Flavipsychrobacter sp.]
MNRRSFIKQSTLATGALLLPAFTKAFTGIPSKVNVVIIGAGFSGLAAAYKLKQKGISFLILESRKRVGGRVFSYPLSEDLVIELGGEWVGNSHARMHELCDEMHLELQNNQMETHLIYKGEYSPKGTWDYSDHWNRKFKSILENYSQFSDDDKKQLDQYDWWRFLVNNGCGGRDLDIRELLDSTDFGESIRHVSAFAALAEYAESSEKNEMDKKIKGGNAKLARALAKKIGLDNILLQHHVAHVLQEKDSATVTCTNGVKIACNKIICTVPTFALSKINWLPVLPELYTEAVNQLQYARINKHALHFSKRFWKDEAFDLVSDQGPHYFYHATKNQPGPEGVLISYSIGDKAAMNANQSDEWRAGEVSRCLRPYFGNVEKYLQSQTNYYWGNDKYSRGAYALYGSGQWFGLMPKLREPFLHTHFAGEHLADWQGFMEGAINSGEEAARVIIG